MPAIYNQREKALTSGAFFCKEVKRVKEMVVKGKVVDGMTRCIHYHSELDIIAVKFACCGQYYPCYFCHQEAENHPVIRWSVRHLHEKAVFCGVCRHEMTLKEYLQGAGACPSCRAKFNPGCRKHWQYYFDRSLLSCIRTEV
jgi:uncharacterized CHY-type Zn-finger protein